MKAMKAALNVALSFAAGAAIVWLLNELVMQRRMQGHFVSEASVREQVLARIAELVSHPDAVLVTVDRGLVHVSGSVLADEMEMLLLELTAVPGVYKVHNALAAVQDANRLRELLAARQTVGT